MLFCGSLSQDVSLERWSAKVDHRGAQRLFHQVEAQTLVRGSTRAGGGVGVGLEGVHIGLLQLRHAVTWCTSGPG